MQFYGAILAYLTFLELLEDAMSESCSSVAYTKFGGEVVCPIVKPQLILNFDQAVAACNNMGASLPIIRSRSDNDNIYAAMINAGLRGIWLYATDRQIEGNFAWRENLSDSINRGYVNWSHRQPDNLHSSEHCMALDVDSKWNDLHCLIKQMLICEKTVQQYSPINVVQKPSIPIFVPFQPRQNLWVYYGKR